MPLRMLLVLVLVLILSTSAPSFAAPIPRVVSLWSGLPPDDPDAAKIGPERIRSSPRSERKRVEVTEPTMLITSVTNPTLTVYSPPRKRNTGTAMVICPGGGYWDLYWQVEGEEVAAWLNSIGVTGIILKYRVPRRPGEPEALPARRPLQDAQRAIRVVRSHAAEWGIHPQKIGIIGFSAGGHLALATATGFDQPTYNARDALDQIDCRPDFAIPVYSGYLKANDKDEVASYLHIPARLSSTSTPTPRTTLVFAPIRVPIRSGRSRVRIGCATTDSYRQ